MKSLFFSLLIAFAFVSCTKETVEPNIEPVDIIGQYQVTYLELNGSGTQLPAEGYTGAISMNSQVVNYKTDRAYGPSQFIDEKFCSFTAVFYKNNAVVSSFNPQFIYVKESTPKTAKLYIDERPVGDFSLENGRKNINFNVVDNMGNRIVFKAQN